LTTRWALGSSLSPAAFFSASLSGALPTSTVSQMKS
jgi:hypothetical protein